MWRKRAYNSESVGADADSVSATGSELEARGSVFIGGSTDASDAYRRVNGCAGEAAAHAALIYCGDGLVCTQFNQHSVTHESQMAK